MEYFDFLKNNLPTSTEIDRIKWANELIGQEIELNSLSDLYLCDYKIASRYLWFLSKVGELDSKKLLHYLPALMELRKNKIHKNTEASFANFWLIAGVPKENESEAIDLLFDWINSPKVNVTGKARSMQALYQLTYKYPELKKELQICLEFQADKYSSNYQEKVRKIMGQL